MSILDQTKKHMSQAIDHLKDDLKKIRTGQANPSLLDPVRATVYGSQMSLNQLATISSPEPRQLLIKPFDQNNKGAIAKAIEACHLGVNPVIEGDAIRITIPLMDEAKRKEMAKICHEKGENAKISIRNTRREGNDEAKKQKSEGLSEDEIKGLEKQIQNLTDDFCKQVDELVKTKEKDILTV